MSNVGVGGREREAAEVHDMWRSAAKV
jgi:hypothetical protein